MSAPPSLSCWAAVIVRLHCIHCGQTIERNLLEATKTLSLCCKAPMEFKGHRKPCACPSCK